MSASIEPRNPAASPDSGSRPRLRLAHVTATFPPYRGGTGNAAWHLSRELAARGHEVHVLTADLGGQPVAPPHVRVHRLRPLLRVGNAPALPGLLPALRGSDLIHLHYPFFFGAELVWAAARAFGIPYVVTYHNDVRLTGPLAPLPHVYHRLVGNRILSDAAALLFTTLDYARSSDASQFVGRPTTAELPLGVDIHRFAPSPGDARLRSKFGVPDDHVLVLMVASLDRAHYFKGLPVMLEAMRLLGDLPLHLLVVGDGDLRSIYATMARDRGLESRVHFAGNVSDSLLPCLYAIADMLVLPSLTRGEAFGLVLLEAMASGKPVIASDLPGVREVVRATGGGLLAEVGNPTALAAAVRCLAQDPVTRCELGRAGLQAVRQNYQWASVAAQLEERCVRLISKGA